MEDTNNTGTTATKEAAPKAETAAEKVVETAKEQAGDKKEAVKKSFKEKFSGLFGKGKEQFVRLVPSEQITVFVGVLLVILSIFDHYLTRAIIAIIGLVMIMVAFAGVKLNDIGKKDNTKKEGTKAEPAPAAASPEAKPAAA